MDGRAGIELTIQIGAETEEEALAILTQARQMSRALLAAPQEKRAAREEQWCSGACRVTLQRPHVDK